MTDIKPDIPQILSRMPLIQQLPPEQIAELAAGTRERRLERGQLLFQKGDPAQGFFYVVMGQIKLAFPSPSGNEKVVEVLGPRQSFGEAVMFMDRPFPLTAEAVSDCLLLHVAAESVFGLLARDALFARRMLGGLAQRLHGLVQDVEAYSLRSSTQRVIGYLLQLCPASDEADAGAIQIELPISKQLIASRLNLTPETLSRVFNELAQGGLITVHGKRVTVHDLTRLREADL